MVFIRLLNHHNLVLKLKLACQATRKADEPARKNKAEKWEPSQ